MKERNKKTEPVRVRGEGEGTVATTRAVLSLKNTAPGVVRVLDCVSQSARRRKRRRSGM